MFYKAKYQGALKQIEELKEKLKQNDVITIERHWQLLCRVSELEKEMNKLEKENRQLRENSNTKSNVKRTRN